METEDYTVVFNGDHYRRVMILTDKETGREIRGVSRQTTLDEQRKFLAGILERNNVDQE